MSREIVLDHRIEDNVYYRQSKENFLQLKALIESHPRAFSAILGSKGRKRKSSSTPQFKHLKEWLDEVTALKLGDPKFTTPTKCYWVMHNLQDFPACKQCGRNEKYLDANVHFWDGYHEYCSNRCMCRSKEVRQKTQRTCLEKYGVANCFQSQDVIHRCQQTKLRNYGNKHFVNPEKSRATRKLHALQDADYKKNIVLKRQRTCIERFGTKNIGQLEEFRKRAKKKYRYDNLQFDSIPEIAYYIWLKDNNIDFTYQPTSFEFVFEGKKHKYFPDFIVEGQLVELKGDQFLKEDGTWRCPWDPQQDSLYEAKHQAAIQHGAKIMYSADYMIYVKYTQDKYNKRFFKQFRNK